METQHLPEKKASTTVQNKGLEVNKDPKQSMPKRVAPTNAPRVAVKRPPAGAPKPLPTNGRVPTKNSQGRPAPQSSAHINSTNSSAVKAPQSKQTTKKPRRPLITAEGISHFFFVILVSLIIYGMLCGIVYAVFYGINHFHFDWNYDITVKLDDSSKKPSRYTTSRDMVFQSETNEPYIAVSRLANSLGLSAVGNANSIRFYQTGNKNGYAVFEDGSKDVDINGVLISLDSPIYIIKGIAYVPISFFNYYTSGISISYDGDKKLMTVTYTVDEALSTPKRKILKDFCFCVNPPQALEELTEKEWFDYVGNRS